MHEAGETARSALNIFAREPIVLALVVMNLALLGLLYWGGVSAEHERTKGIELLYENRKYVADILSKCYPAPPPKNR